MSTVDPEPTDHGDGEPSFAWGDNIPSDSEDDEYTRILPTPTKIAALMTLTATQWKLTSSRSLDVRVLILGRMSILLASRPAPQVQQMPQLFLHYLQVSISSPFPSRNPIANKYLTEIRNLIYSFMPSAAIWAGQITLARTSSKESGFPVPGFAPGNPHLIPGSNISFDTPPSECTDWTRLRRQFLGLTQVNRQLRKEAVTSRDGFVIGVFLDQLEAYIADFYVKSARKLTQLCWTRIHLRQNASVDVKSLSLTMAGLSEQCSYMFYRQDLPGWLFGTNVSAEWVSYLQHSVSRLLVRTDRSKTWVSILVHGDHAEDWMCTWNGSGTVPVEHDAWLNMYGLDCRRSVKLTVSMDWKMSCGYVLTEFEVALLS
jgi:hypothetical protein